MVRRYVSRQITPVERVKIRKIIREVKWKPATSAAYKDSPHSYIIAYDFPLDRFKMSAWKMFSTVIAQCGEYHEWTPKGSNQSYRYKYLVLDGYCYWVDFPALNRAKADTINPYVETK